MALKKILGLRCLGKRAPVLIYNATMLLKDAGRGNGKNCWFSDHNSYLGAVTEWFALLAPKYVFKYLEFYSNSLKNITTVSYLYPQYPKDYEECTTDQDNISNRSERR